MSISIQNYLGAVILTLLACSLPATAYAEVYKCKNPDGAMTYSDQPCPGSPGKPKADSNSETWKSIQEFNSKKNVSKEEADQLILRYDKDFYENKKRCDDKTLKGCEKLFETLGKLANDLRQACTKGGDKKSCKESCPSTLWDKQASADDLLACAKGLELTHGDYWLIRQGRLSSFGSRRSPTGEEVVLYDKTLIPLKDGRNGGISDLDLLCFRKKKICFRSGN